MTIRIAQDVPVVLGTPNSAVEPAGDAFALALRTRMRPASAPAEHAAAVARSRAHGPEARAELRTPPQADRPEAPLPTQPQAPTDQATPAAPAAAAADAAVAALQTLTAAAAGVGTDGAAGIGQPAASAGLDASAAGSGVAAGMPTEVAVHVATASAAQAQAVDVASAEMVLTTHRQQAAVSQAVIDPATAADRGPLLTAAASSETLFRAADALAAQTAPVDPAGPGAGTVATDLRASAFGGAAMAGARPYALSANDAPAAPGDLTAVSGPSSATAAPTAPAPGTIGAATGAAATPSLTPTGSTGAVGSADDGFADASSAGAADDGAADDGAGLATATGATSPAAGIVAVGTNTAAALTGSAAGVATNEAPAPTILPPAAETVPDAVAAQHGAARAAVDQALADSTAPLVARPGDGSSATVRDAADERSTSGSVASATAARATEPSPPPAAPVPLHAPPQHAPAVTAAGPSVPAQAAAPPPALHSQILSAVTPALHRRDGSYSVELQLDPASLGRVRVQLAIAGGEVSLNLASGDAATRDLLRQHMDQLRQQLAESGFGRSSVDVGDDARGNPWQDAQNRQAAGTQADGPGQGHGGSRGGQDAGSGGDPSDRTDQHDHLEQAQRATRENRGDGPLDVRI